MTRFALTFDDGPGPSTAALLDVLRENGTPATFFLLGRNVEEAPWCGGDPSLARELVRRAAREGHVLGNHSYSHLKPERWRDFADDVRRGERVVRELRGGDAPVPFRLPYGLRPLDGESVFGKGPLDPRLPVITSLGLRHQHWTGDFDDWTLGPDDGARLATATIAHVRDCEALGLDAVLDLHDSGTGSSFGYARPATVEGVRRFLAEAARAGWTPFTVPAV